MIMDAGWDRILTPGAFRLLMRIARRVDRHGQTRMKLPRLRAEAGLSEPGFFSAKRQLVRYALLHRKKVGGAWIITLPATVPVPPLSARREKTLHPDRKNYPPEEYLLSKRIGAKRRTPQPERVSANGQQKTKTQLEGQSGGQTRGFSALALQQWQEGLAERFPAADVSALQKLLRDAAEAVAAGAPLLDISGPLLDAFYDLGCRLDVRGRYLTELQLVDPLRAAGVGVS